MMVVLMKKVLWMSVMMIVLLKCNAVVFCGNTQRDKNIVDTFSFGRCWNVTQELERFTYFDLRDLNQRKGLRLLIPFMFKDVYWAYENRQKLLRDSVFTFYDYPYNEFYRDIMFLVHIDTNYTDRHDQWFRSTIDLWQKHLTYRCDLSSFLNRFKCQNYGLLVG